MFQILYFQRCPRLWNRNKVNYSAFPFFSILKPFTILFQKNLWANLVLRWTDSKHVGELGLSDSFRPFGVLISHLCRLQQIAGKEILCARNEQKSKRSLAEAHQGPWQSILFTYFVRGEKHEEHPTSGNYSPVCWLMIAVMRWSKANIPPAVLLLVRNSIYLSYFYFYPPGNLSKEESMQHFWDRKVEKQRMFWGQYAVMGQSATCGERYLGWKKME